MTDLTPVAGWDSVRQLETNEPALGGAGGNMNEQAQALYNRTEQAKTELTQRYTKTEADALFIPLTQRGAVSGVATLGPDGFIVVGQQRAASTTAPGSVQLNDTLTSASTAQALTANQGKVLNDKMLGVGQTWQDLTASRALNTTYTNTTSKPILVSVSSNATQNAFYKAVVGGVDVSYSNGSFSTTSKISVSFIVPAGSTYSVVNSNIAPILLWSELR